MSCEDSIEVTEDLQLEQLRNISLALVDLHNMAFYDIFRSRSCY